MQVLSDSTDRSSSIQEMGKDQDEDHIASGWITAWNGHVMTIRRLSDQLYTIADEDLLDNFLPILGRLEQREEELNILTEE